MELVPIIHLFDSHTMNKINKMDKTSNTSSEKNSAITFTFNGLPHMALIATLSHSVYLCAIYFLRIV